MHSIPARLADRSGLAFTSFDLPLSQLAVRSHAGPPLPPPCAPHSQMVSVLWLHVAMQVCARLYAASLGTLLSRTVLDVQLASHIVPCLAALPNCAE